MQFESETDIGKKGRRKVMADPLGKNQSPSLVSRPLVSTL